MARSSARKLCAAAHKFVLLLCAALTVAVAGDVVTYSFPAFDATTTDNLVAATNSSILTPASLLFASPSFFAGFNVSEGFLLLPRAVEFWRAAGTGGAPADDREASFNTSFTLVAGAAPVSFVVLKDAFPPLNGRGGLRGAGANYTAIPGGPVPSNATAGSIAFVEVGAVRSYGPDVPTAGLNVTVTSRAGGGGCAAWIEYHASVHRLSVYVAGGAGDPKPANALVSMPLGAEGRWTTQTAFVGFFAGTIRDVIVGVQDWELTVDRFPDGGNKDRASWWVILLAVLGSVVAASAIVTAVVCYFQTMRRRQLNMDPKI